MAFTTAFVFFHPKEVSLFLLEVFSVVKVFFIIKFPFEQPVSFWFMDTFFLKLFPLHLDLLVLALLTRLIVSE